MENQKTNDSNARNVGNEGSGSSMGKDSSSNMDQTGSSKSAGFGNLDNGLDKGAAEAHDTIDKAADAAKPMADRIASSAHAGVDKVSTALTGVSARMEDKTKQLNEAYKQFSDTSLNYVRTSPGKSVLIALAAGFTLSKLLGRRR